jgi:hypothetical protein
MGMDVDTVERSEAASADGQDVEKTTPLSAQPVKKAPEPTFDTGLTAWLQVFGSFFLFFNSWCVPSWILS